MKTAQKFLSTRTFSLFPDITKLDIPINDSSLEKYFNLSKKEKYSIERQVKNGEGNLTEKRRKEIIDFSLKNVIDKNEMEFIKKELKNAKINDKKTFKTLKKRKRTKRRQKKTRSRKNN